MIAKATIMHLNIDHTDIEVDLSVKENRRDWYLKINPNGTVPALKDGDYCLSETLAIWRYLPESRNINTEFYPYKDAKKLAEVNELIDLASGRFRYKSMYCYFQLLMGPTFFGNAPHPPEKRQKFLEGVYECYQNVEDLLSKSGTRYLLNDSKI